MKYSRFFPISSILQLLAFVCGLLAFPGLLTALQPYHLLDSWQVGGEGKWDYLVADSSAHRLFLTHGDRVEVLDTQSGKLVGAISGLHKTHGIALDDTGSFGYISDGGGNAVVVFNRSTLATIATILVGQNPDAILFESTTRTIWAFNGKSRTASVIDVATRKVIATIPLPGKPEFAVTDGKGTIYDNIEDKSEIIRLDAKSKKLTAEWPLTGCNSPSGLAFDVNGARLFSVCDNKKMTVIDSNTGKSLATAVIGDAPDDAGWSAAHMLAFSSNGGGDGLGTLTVIDANAPGYPAIEQLPTHHGARTMAYDAATDRIYLVAVDYGPRPDPTPNNPHPQSPILPDSLRVLVVGRY